MKKCLLFFATLFLLTGCASDGSVTQQDVGTITGGILGGVIGSQFGSGSGAVAAGVGGAIIGGLIGSSIGAQLDRESRYRAERAARDAIRSGHRRSWHTKRAHGTVDPYKTYYSRGRRCRRYVTTVWIEGKGRRRATGVACRRRGQWRIVR